MVLAAAVFAACEDETSLAPNGTVNADGTTFSPQTVTLSPSEKIVTWGIFGGGPHNITFEDGVTSGDRSSGAYSRNFTTDTVGTYRYRCTNHSLADFTTGMVGVIIVQ
jgi:plastocyanin